MQVYFGQSPSILFFFVFFPKIVWLTICRKFWKVSEIFGNCLLVRTHNFIKYTMSQELPEVADLKMKLAATVAALQTFVDSEKNKYKAAEALLCSTTKDNFAEVASSIINPTPIREYFGGPKEVLLPYTSEGHEHSVGLDSDVEDETDSVLSAKEQEEQDRLFERIVVKPMTHQEKKDEVAALRIASKKPAAILWKRFECVFAMRETDWHGDICTHLEEQCQQYLDDYMEEGAVVTEATLTKCPEYGVEYES